MSFTTLNICPHEKEGKKEGRHTVGASTQREEGCALPGSVYFHCDMMPGGGGEEEKGEGNHIFQRGGEKKEGEGEESADFRKIILKGRVRSPPLPLNFPITDGP